MDKVYAVTEGEWDDFRIVAIYTTLEEAVEEVAENWEDYGIRVGIQEWEVGVKNGVKSLFSECTLDMDGKKLVEEVYKLL